MSIIQTLHMAGRSALIVAGEDSLNLVRQLQLTNIRQLQLTNKRSQTHSSPDMIIQIGSCEKTEALVSKMLFDCAKPPPVMFVSESARPTPKRDFAITLKHPKKTCAMFKKITTYAATIAGVQHRLVNNFGEDLSSVFRNTFHTISNETLADNINKHVKRYFQYSGLYITVLTGVNLPLLDICDLSGQRGVVCFPRSMETYHRILHPNETFTYEKTQATVCAKSLEEMIKHECEHIEYGFSDL